MYEPLWELVSVFFILEKYRSQHLPGMNLPYLHPQQQGGGGLRMVVPKIAQPLYTLKKHHNLGQQFFMQWQICETRR